MNRLFSGLQDSLADPRMLVRFKDSNREDVQTPTTLFGRRGKNVKHFLNYLPVLPTIKYTNTDMFSPSIVPSNVHRKINEIDADLVHLHWVFGILTPRSISKIAKPIVWTFHDMWGFTGGCHYSGDCNKFKDGCGSCPQLLAGHPWDISCRQFRRQVKLWQNRSITVICPSKWMADRAKDSPFLSPDQIHIIRNGIDTGIYRPHDQNECRQQLGLPPDENLILFGGNGTSRRKGADLLAEMIRESAGDAIRFVEFGNTNVREQLDDAKNLHTLGFVKDGNLPNLFSAADILVVPSRVENYPNMVLESMACGTPCVAFRVGGIPELVSHKRNGYLAEPERSSSLTEGVRWVLASEGRAETLGRRAREFVINECAIKSCVNQHRSLYETLLRDASRPSSEGDPP